MYEVNVSKCTGCGICLESCPFDAIFMVDNKAQIDEYKCRECRKCLDVCPTQAIEVRLEPNIEPIPVQSVTPSESATIAPKKVAAKQGFLTGVLEFLNQLMMPRNGGLQEANSMESNSYPVGQPRISKVSNRTGTGRGMGRGYGRRKRGRGRRW